MQLNDIFNIDKYNEAYEYVNQNGYMIKEIKKNLNGERQFKIVNIPAPSETDKLQNEINELKQKLVDTDYQAIKFAEGIITSEEYAEMKAQRQVWRDRINELELKKEYSTNS